MIYDNDVCGQGCKQLCKPCREALRDGEKAAQEAFGKFGELLEKAKAERGDIQSGGPNG